MYLHVGDLLEGAGSNVRNMCICGGIETLLAAVTALAANTAGVGSRSVGSFKPCTTPTESSKSRRARGAVPKGTRQQR